jgi:hypothetical protein
MKIKQTLCGLLGGLLSYVAPGSIPATTVATMAKAAPVIAVAGGAMLTEGCSSGGSSGSSSSGDDDDDPPTPDPVHAYWATNPPQEIFEDSTLPIHMRAERDSGTSDFQVTDNDNFSANKFFLWWQNSSGGAWDNETPNPTVYYHLHLSSGVPSNTTIECQRTFPNFYLKPAGQYNIKVNAKTIDDSTFYFSTTKPLTINFSDANAIAKIDKILTDFYSGHPKYGGHGINGTVSGIPAEAYMVWDGKTITFEALGKADAAGDKRAQFAAVGVDCCEITGSHNEDTLRTKIDTAKLDDFTGNDINTDGKQSPY